jgi:hypothetical protein
MAARKHNSMMKKFLEVLVDENGTYHFSTDEQFTTEEEFAAGDNPAKLEYMEACHKRLTQLVHDMTEFMWKTQDQNVCQAVRLVAMAEILGCAQPYERAEEFWSLMMFHTIPQFEDFAAAIKKSYGFDDRHVTRPIVGGPLIDGPNIMAFPIPQPFGKIIS